jgi:hypothetical protein
MPKPYAPPTDVLVARGFSVASVCLLNKITEAPIPAFDTHVKLVQNVVRDEVDKDDVGLLMLSYDGMIGTEAALGLSVEEQRAKGNTAVSPSDATCMHLFL